MNILRNTAAQLVFCLSIMIGACAILGAVAITNPAFAQDACQTTVDSVLLEAKQLNVTADRITTVEDLDFIVAYHEALGIDIPEDSNPKRFIMIDLGPRVYIAIIEQDNCIKYQTGVEAKDHEAALKAAAAGV